jgi:hypothetical protein
VTQLIHACTQSPENKPFRNFFKMLLPNTKYRLPINKFSRHLLSRPARLDHKKRSVMKKIFFIHSIALYPYRSVITMLRCQFLLLVITALTFSSCNESIPVPKVAKAVYVAGTEGNVAKYWNNGIATSLSDGTNLTYAMSIFVKGSDVYVAGTEVLGGGSSIAKYWKNGIVTDLSLSDGSTSGEANSIFVHGSDVYVAGTDDGAAVLWKNGIVTTLTDAGGIAHAVFVKGSDVYVAGSHGVHAMYWKNGIGTNLTDGTNPASAHAIFVSGSDVYFAGANYPGNVTIDAVYWKNGIMNVLPDDGGYASANSIFVVGSDVHVTGWDGTSSKAAYWKNGVRTILNEDDDEHASARSIFVSKSDVYIAGYEANIAKYWKNGTPIYLTDGTESAAAHAIFVKELAIADSFTE